MEIWATPTSNSVPYLSQYSLMPIIPAQLSNLSMNMASISPAFTRPGPSGVTPLAAVLLVLVVNLWPEEVVNADLVLSLE